MKTFRANSSHRGFTLIELMIAMLIGVFLMAGVIQIFLSAKQAYRLQENLSRLQENGRFAMDILTKDVRMAGFSGCASKSAMINVVDPNKVNKSFTDLMSSAIRGINNVTSTDCATLKCLTGTDILSVQSVSSCGANVTEKSNAQAASLKVTAPNTCNIGDGDIVIVSNCSSATAFGVSNVQNIGGNPPAQNVVHSATMNIMLNQNNAAANNCSPYENSKFCKDYSSDSEVFKSNSMSYFIGSGAGGVPALWSINSAKAGATPDELIEGIENMQILYGVDTDATQDFIPNYYVPVPAPFTPTGATAAIDGWARVVSVRINLLAVTIENNLTDAPQPYFYDGTTTTPPQIPVLKADTSQYCQAYTGSLPSNCQLVDDRRIHRVFSSTIAVRNRLP